MLDRRRLVRTIRALRQGRRAPPGPAEYRLTVRDEARLLATHEGWRPGAPLPAGGRVLVSAGPGEARQWLARLSEATWLPRAGAIIDAAGAMHLSSVGQALQDDPGLESFGYLRQDGAGFVFRPPARPPRLAAATVWLPFHAQHNYGHFMLDALPSVVAALRAGVLAEAPLAAPPLKRWQKDLLGLAFGEDLAVREVDAQVVRLGEAVYASSLFDFLHRPTETVLEVRDRILRRAPARARTPARRIFLSRRGWSMRVMVNEDALEAALVARGFQVVRPETLPVAEQVALMREAEIIVAPSGAGLANALFAPPSAQVIEILPVEFGGLWVQRFRELTGGRHHIVFCPRVAAAQAPLAKRLRLGFTFAYRVDVAEVLGALAG